MAYSDDRKEIRAAFEDGMDELFRIMFTESVILHPLDTEKTQPNVYGETDKKYYGKPFSLTAKVIVKREQGEENVQTIQQTATMTVPNKQLDVLEIPHTTDKDLSWLQQCAVEYNGVLFLIDKVTRKTMVADAYLFYEFNCTTYDKDDTEYIFYKEPDPENPDNPDVPVDPDTPDPDTPTPPENKNPDAPVEGDTNG